LAEKERENAQLRAEVARLLAELVLVNERLTQQQAASNERLAQLVDAVAKANDRIHELLVIAKRKKSRVPAPSKPPEAPPPLGDIARQAFDNRPSAPVPGQLNDRPKPRPQPTGRKDLPSSLPSDESTVYPDRCPCGCTDFEWVDEVVEEKLDIRAHQRKRVTHRKTGRCRRCQRRTTAEAPPSPFERSKVTCEWQAWFLAQKFWLLVPLDRIRRYLGAQGVPLSMSFLVSQVEAAADLLDAIDGEHWKQLLAGDHLASDGTGFDVQVKGVGLHHGFIEVYHHDGVVVFQYEPEKGGDTQASKLARFEGALLVDAEARYNETMRRNPRIVEANCNAHPRRKLRDAEAVQPVLAAEGGCFVSAMFEHEAEAKTLGLKGADLLAWRQGKIKPLTERFRTWMEAVYPTLLPNDPLARVIQYYRNHWQPLMRFLDDPNIAIDNSASEREFQPVAKVRLNSLFAGGTEGAHRACVLLGISATCRRLDVDFEAYLTWVFVRRGTHRDKYAMTAAELTPAAYAKAHPRPAS
jgi:transposase